jgi:hypothetical protein
MLILDKTNPPPYIESPIPINKENNSVPGSTLLGSVSSQSEPTSVGIGPLPVKANLVQASTYADEKAIDHKGGNKGLQESEDKEPAK